jgi:hypothetical protein
LYNFLPHNFLKRRDVPDKMGMNEVHQSIICAGCLRDCWETQRKKKRKKEIRGRNKQGGCKREK